MRPTTRSKTTHEESSSSSVPSSSTYPSRSSTPLSEYFGEDEGLFEEKKEQIKHEAYIVLEGSAVKLHTTEAFKTFWQYLCERLSVDMSRRSGQSPPWTDDDILQKFHFCQVYRATDRVSQYIITNVIEKGPQDPKEVFFRVVLFDRFTKIETWEKLLAVSPSGEMEWDHFDNNIAFYEQSLHVLEAAPGTGRFQKPAPRKWGAGYDHVRSCLKLTQLMVSDNLHEKLLKMNYLRDAFDEIKNYPSFGDFSAFQLLIGLSYTEVLGRFSPNDFVALGPGAISGIKKMFHARDLQQAKRTLGEKVDLFADIVRHLTEHQDEWFKTFGLEFPGLGPDHLPLDMVDIEHSLCELDKYCRQAHPSLKGGKSITMPGKHTTSKVPLPREHTLPAVWSLPSRQIPRIRPAGVKSAKANMRYWVLGIVDDRLGSKGQEYKVQWVGYPGEDTWEPESLLTEDVPNLLDEYKASKTAKPISKKRKRK